MFRLLNEILLVSKVVLDTEEVLGFDNSCVCFLFKFLSEPGLEGIPNFIFSTNERKA